MAILWKSNRIERPQIDLTGPDGNVFVVMAYAEQYARRIDIDPEPIIKDMMSSDYEHALQVFDEHFGEYVDLLR